MRPEGSEQLKLYTYEIAPNPRRLHLFMQYKGISIDTEEVDLGKLEQLDEAYLAINPDGTVPALLLDDGSLLSDSIACCVYLESQYPEKPLLGSNDLERAQVIGWMHKIFFQGLMAVAEILRNQGKAFADRPLPGPRRLEQIPALVERGRLRLADFFEYLEKSLQNRQYLVGDRLSQADIDGFVAVDFAGWVKESIPAHCEGVQAWYERVKMELN